MFTLFQHQKIQHHQLTFPLTLPILISPCHRKKSSNTFYHDWSELGITDIHHHKIDTGDARPILLPFYRQIIQVRKECSTQVRHLLDVDYRKLNAVTEPIVVPLPRFDDVIDSVGESHAQIFNVLDCVSRFWQIPLDPATKDRSAFIILDGIFEWNRLPFGLKNAPLAFQQTISIPLKEMKWKYILRYADDVIVTHLQHLECIFCCEKSNVSRTSV